MVGVVVVLRFALCNQQRLLLSGAFGKPPTYVIYGMNSGVL